MCSSGVCRDVNSSTAHTQNRSEGEAHDETTGEKARGPGIAGDRVGRDGERTGNKRGERREREGSRTGRQRGNRGVRGRNSPAFQPGPGSRARQVAFARCPPTPRTTRKAAQCGDPPTAPRTGLPLAPPHVDPSVASLLQARGSPTGVCPAPRRLPATTSFTVHYFAARERPAARVWCALRTQPAAITAACTHAHSAPAASILARLRARAAPTSSLFFSSISYL